MNPSGPARYAAHRKLPVPSSPSWPSSPSSDASDHHRARCEADLAIPTTGITIYGCEQDEAALFRALAPHFGVVPTVTDAAVSEANIELTLGNRCISVSHKTQITHSTLHALAQAGVRYLSTRSVGYDHINLKSARSMGISVENVAYSPDSVADYTLMLTIMMLRDAKSIISRAQVYDYRLNDVRGKELRDMTVGVVGTGRIGAAVINRSRGFGCQILAYDRYPKSSAEYVPLKALLQQSDVVTLHTPLTADTYHLLDRRRIEQMRHGAFIINTGRGALLDTQALIPALESGHLAGVALDVLEGEEGIFYSDRRERPIESPLMLRLQQLPNVIITPHTAYYTEHALRDTVENTIINCLGFERATACVG